MVNEKYITHKNLILIFTKRNLILKHTNYTRGNNLMKSSKI